MATIVVGISGQSTALPPDFLVTYALGSCVGVCLVDPATHVGGLAHILLPTSFSEREEHQNHFADTALPRLVGEMGKLGADPGRIVAKIAGGAQMFEPIEYGDDCFWRIGERNVQAVTEALQEMSIPILAKDVYQDYGRTLLFDPATGIMTVQFSQQNATHL